MAIPLPPSSPALSFSLSSQATASSPRCGVLSFSSPSEPRDLRTPAVIAYTKRGALPHITRDNVIRLPIEVVHVSLENVLEKDGPPVYSEAPFSLARALGLHAGARQRQQLITMSLRDPSSLEYTNSVDTALSAKTTSGFVKVTPADYLRYVLPHPPDVLFALADEPVIADLSKRRVRTSIARSFNWISELAAGAKGRVNLFAPLVGGNNIAARTEFANRLRGGDGRRGVEEGGVVVDESLAGYVLTIPLNLPTSDPSVPTLLLASLAPLPLAKPRVALAASGPHNILRLVRDVGIDLFVDEWSSLCATSGVALDFAFPVAIPLPETTSKLDVGLNCFDPALAKSFIPLSSSPLATPTPPPLLLPFLSPSQAASYHPAASTPPTRAYLNHLLTAHELTAHVLLALHNQVVMHNFFSAIRTVLEADDTGVAFASAVDAFFAMYEEGTAFSGGRYPCLVAAQEGLAKVNSVRGKGTLKGKRLVEAAEGVVTPPAE